MLPPGMRAALVLMTVGLGLLARPAAADALTDALKDGPLVRVEVDKQGRFKRSTVILDVDAPVDQVWATLADFKSYPTYMPRCEEVEVQHKPPYVYVEMDIDTPLVSTSYKSRYQLFPEKRQADIKVVDGDIEGSEFTWKMEGIGERTRITYTGVIRNFSSVAESLDDDQQSITIGINVVSLLQAAKALKQEAERRVKLPPKGPPAP